MPERNLVEIMDTKRCCKLLCLALAFGSMQLGCSKLGQSTFNRDLLSGKARQPLWSSDTTDSASRYVSDPMAELESDEHRVEAKIVGIRDGDSTDIDVKLTASQPALALETTKTNSLESVNNLFCEHPEDCDCHKPKIKPMLPHAEPIDPPPFVANAPPSGVINQPLAPILFDSQTREIQMADAEHMNNSLRRNEQWSHEKTATVSNKQNATDLAILDPNLARSNPSPHQIGQLIDSSDLSRIKSETESLSPDVSNAESHAQAACVSCQDVLCDGNSNNHTSRIATRNIRPIVDSEPVVIVATTSPDTIPPFAEFPPHQGGVETVADLGLVNTDPTQRATPPVVTAAPQTGSLDDPGDHDWLAMFGPIGANGPVCPACESDQCQDPECKNPRPDRVGETAATQVANRVVSMNEAAVSPATEMDNAHGETDIAQASPIASNSSPESNNDFQPASHSTEAENIEIESELSTWLQPTAPALVATVTPDSDPFPAGSTATAELAGLDVSPGDAPDTQKQPVRSSRPQAYAGLPVRFEVIDNTVPWNEKLAETIQNVKSQLALEVEPATRNGLEVNLRLLEILQRQMADVEVRNDSLSNEEKQYWQHQLDALTMMLNSSDVGESDLTRHHTAIETLDHLRKAVERLESIAELRITNGAFCTAVSGFGQFRAFPSTTFSPGQRMLVYCEVENYSSTQRQAALKSEVVTRLRGSFVIYNEQGRAVQQAEYPIVEDVSTKRRRDFYMHFPVQLGNLTSGHYRLELMVEDLNGNKTGSVEPGLEFRVQ